MPEPLLRGALATAREIVNGKARMDALIGLMSHLPEIDCPEVLQEILTAVDKIVYEEDQNYALKKLIARLPEPLLREALKIAQEIWSEPFRGHIPRELALQLAALGDSKDALTVEREIGDEVTQIHAVEMPRPYFSRVESTTVQHEILMGRGQTDSCLEMEETGLSIRSRLKMLLLTENREITNPLAQVEIVEKFASGLPEPLVREALTQARQDWLLEPLVQEALEYARQHRSDLLSRQVEVGFTQEYSKMKERQAVTLMGLAPRLAELGYPEEALIVVREIADEKLRAKALGKLAGHLPEIEASQVLHEVLAVIEIADKKSQFKALASLVSYLPEVERNQALQEVLRVAREGAVGSVELAHCLAELGYSEEALTVAREIADKELRMKVLTELVSHLPEFERTQILQQALVTAREIVDEEERIEALIGLAPHLKEVDRIQVLKEALMAAWASEKQAQWLEGTREVLAKLVSRLPESLLSEVVKAAQGIEGTASREDILWDLGLLLAELGHTEALDTTRNTADKKYRNYILTKLLQRLAERSYSAEVWIALVPRLAALGYSEESLKMARRIKLRVLRTEALWRRQGSHLARLSYANLVSLWSERLHDLAQHPRASLLLELSELAPAIATLGGSAAISETFRAIQDVGRWWP